MLTPSDTGKLQHKMRVKVGERVGTVVSVHEPQWRDHKTRTDQHVLQGADIAFDDQPGRSEYVHCDKIEIL